MITKELKFVLTMDHNIKIRLHHVVNCVVKKQTNRSLCCKCVKKLHFDSYQGINSL